MVALKALFHSGQAGITAYYPDCTHSRLWGNLDHAIHEATGFQVVYRQWINHDVNSTMRFYSEPGQKPPKEQDTTEALHKYESVPPAEIQHGHLFARLLLSGPSLLTVWQGDNAIETLLALKGKTHPAEADAKTIRGGFWCDNAICNLMHTSDNADEAQHELAAIHLTHLLDETVTTMRLIDPTPEPEHHVAHCGLLVVCRLVNRLLVTMNKQAVQVKLPPSGDAKETNQQLGALLRKIASDVPGTVIAEFIPAYLAGDMVAVTALMKQLPVTKWEHYMVQCGAHTRDKWNLTP